MEHQVGPALAPIPRSVRRRGRSVVGVLASAVMVVGGLAVAVHHDKAAPQSHRRAKAATSQPAHHDTPPPPPAQWDPRVAPLAQFAAQHRHLTWRHPVLVRFLSPASYRRAALGSADPDGSRIPPDDVRDVVAEYRALGLVQGRVDLQATIDTLADDGTLAFYDLDTKVVNVRGTDLTPGVRQTVVHELTHALQDQHFDLPAMERRVAKGSQGDSAAVRGLVEGDAMRIEDEYHQTLNAHDQAAADYAMKGDPTQTASVDALPSTLVGLFSAPYDFGSSFVEFVEHTQGAEAIDDAFRDPPTTMAELWDPFVYLARKSLHPLDEPAVPRGAKEFDDGQLGSVVWFEMLTQRVPPTVALEAVDGWAGDAYVAYRRSGKECVDAHFRGEAAADAAEMLHALQVWQAGRPAGAATVSLRDGLVRLHTCDPGPDADLHLSDHGGDEAVPVVRAELDAALVDEPDAPDNWLATVRCVANEFVRHYSVDQLNADDVPNDIDAVMNALVQQCQRDPQHYSGAPHR